MKYKSKPSECEATQYTHPGCECPGVSYEPETDFTSRPFVVTIHGQRCYIEPGDYIVQEPDGVHYYPVKPEIFEKRWGADGGGYSASEVAALCAARTTAVESEAAAQEAIHWAQAILTALNVGDIRSGSLPHLKLRDVMISYWKAKDRAEPAPAPETRNEP